MEAPPDVRVVQPSDTARTAVTLARAFFFDPVMTFLVPDVATRHARLYDFFYGMLDVVHVRHGYTFMTTDATAAAVWDPPGHWRVGILEQIRIAPRVLGALASNVFTAMRTLGAMERFHIKESHYYLAILGTDPAYQGRGHGAAALAPVLARCDAEGAIAYLESSNMRNVPFYRRQGFEVIQDLTLPGGGPTIALMQRAPRGAR